MSHKKEGREWEETGGWRAMGRWLDGDAWLWDNAYKVAMFKEGDGICT